MSLDETAIFAAWSILLVLAAAIAPRLHRAVRLVRPASQPLYFDPPDFDLDGPVIDMEPA